MHSNQTHMVNTNSSVRVKQALSARTDGEQDEDGDALPGHLAPLQPQHLLQAVLRLHRLRVRRLLVQSGGFELRYADTHRGHMLCVSSFRVQSFRRCSNLTFRRSRFGFCALQCYMLRSAVLT